jgi:hypothetical protein
MGKSRENSQNGTCALGEGGTELFKGLPNGIVKCWTNLANELATTVRPGAIGEQDNSNPRIKVYP